MEKDNTKTQGTKRLWVSKLKNRNVKMLKEIIVKGSEELKEEILEMYDKLKKVWYEKDLSKVEKKEIEDFLSKKIIKIEEVKEEKINKYVEKYKEIKKLIENKLYIEIAGLKVMKNNFKVDSKGWKEIVDQNWVKVRVNDGWDIWEYVGGDFDWEQLFTRDAADREVGKIKWIRMIKEWEKEEEKEWSKIIKACWWETEQEQGKNTVDKLWKKFCGYRNHNDGQFRHVGMLQTIGYYMLMLSKQGAYGSETMIGSIINTSRPLVLVFALPFRTKFDYLTIWLFKY